MIDRRRFLIGALAALPATCRRRSWRMHGGGGAAGGSGGPPGHEHMHGGAMRGMAGHGATATPAPRVRPLHPEKLARFVDPLPVPPVLAPVDRRPDPRDPSAQAPLYRVTMRAADQVVHRDLPPTRFWTYEGSTPGPTIETRSGAGLLVEWRNELPDRHLFAIDHTLCGAGTDRPDVRAIVHVHGAKAPPESDGYPEDWYVPGRSATYHYPNRQEAATLWYHDHAMGIERLNQYAGLFGMFLVRDEAEDRLALPSGPHEIPLVLFDRLFDVDGQLVYPTSGNPDAPWVTEFYGDVLLVNGKLFPYFDVEPRAYRFRILNASNARVFYLSLRGQGDGGSGGLLFHQIGSDQGLLGAPVPMGEIALAPAERADVVVDFAAARGQTVVLKSQSFELLQFRVGGSKVGKGPPLPAVLRPVPRTPLTSAVRTRRLPLNEYEDPKTHTMLMLLNGTRWHQPVTERPALDSVEIWEFVNLTADAHPIHLHLVRFQIVNRQLFDADEFLFTGKMTMTSEPMPPPPNEAGWKDTVRVDPGTITRVIVRFEGYAGRYVWHCHILEHAANEMMRPFEVIAG